MCWCYLIGNGKYEGTFLLDATFTFVDVTCFWLLVSSCLPFQFLWAPWSFGHLSIFVAWVLLQWHVLVKVRLAFIFLMNKWIHSILWLVTQALRMLLLVQAKEICHHDRIFCSLGNSLSLANCWNQRSFQCINHQPCKFQYGSPPSPKDQRVCYKPRARHSIFWPQGSLPHARGW